MKEGKDRFEIMLNAIDAERLHEEAFFKKIGEGRTLQQKVNAGYIWYPVEVVRKSFTIGDYLEIEVRKIQNSASSHKFSEGAAVSLFNVQQEREDYKSIVSFIRGDKMRLMLHADHIENWEIFEKGLTGVEMIYDDKPYKIMEKAIRQVINSKKDNISHLRQGLINNIMDDKDIRTDREENRTKYRKDLNESQKIAIETCMKAPNLGIIHGPPGTGKTTTIVGLIEALLENEKRILVCASSNNAVDLLAERLSARGVQVLRVGNITRIHDDLMHLTIEEKVRNHPEWKHIKKVKMQAREVESKAGQFKRNFGAEEINERRERRKEAKELRKWAVELEDRLIEQIVTGSQVIATTLIGVSNRILADMHFKTVIIDEASQALEPECWNAILKADRVILAGDHKQLPPTVKSTDAIRLGLDKTMLDFMADNIRHTSLLTEQYRMHEKILGFSNNQYYGGKLLSNELVSNRTLRNDQLPLVFIDTAGCGFEEIINNEQRSYYNHGEFFIIREHILANAEKLVGTNIGIISPYSEQVRYIREQISEDRDLCTFDIEVNSIDGFQGQEKEVIYISLVRCNDMGEIGFLKDERRLNVAMTRAQKKLIVIGDSATLGQYTLFSNLISHVEQEGHYDSAWNYMGY